MKFTFKNMKPKKNNIVFTWDDNLLSHAQIIAPVFCLARKRCTFYINPGSSDFIKNFSKNYRHLCIGGFELGSHGYVHQYFSKLSGQDYSLQLTKARNSIKQIFQHQPTTFAFPHHDYNGYMLSQARNIYLETRNILYNSRRFSLKTGTLIESVKEALMDANDSRYTLVFSGHGAFNSVNIPRDCGYEPIALSKLQEILALTDHYSNLQVCTFEQATLQTFLQLYGKWEDDSVWLDEAQIAFLTQFGLNPERILSLI